MLRTIPLLAFVAVAYNVLALVTGSNPDASALSVRLPSQATWSLSIGDLLVAIGICVLYLEILKATRTSAAAVLDHALSIIVFVICLLEFLLIPQMGTASFFLITLMTFVDVIAGFTVTISAARRDVGLGSGLR